jgi:hypothetical protein
MAQFRRSLEFGAPTARQTLEQPRKQAQHSDRLEQRFRTQVN